MPVQQYTGEMRMFLSLALLILVVIIGVVFVVLLRRAKQRSEPEVHKRAAIRALLSDQDDAISNVISEITSQPATYAGFPSQILADLMRLHDAYPRVIKGRFREDY